MLSRLCRSGLCLLAVTSVAGRELQAQADSLYHPTAVDTITLSGPLVLGYFPPVTQAQVDSDESLASALSHVEFALDDARKCLPKDSVAVDLAFATTLVVLDGDQVTRLPLTPSAFPLGAYILIPGMAPRLILPTAGPSALIPMLWQATAEAFHQPKCNHLED